MKPPFCYFEIIMHGIHGGLGFGYNDDLGMKLSLVGQCLMFVYGWAHRGSAGGGLF